MELWHLKQIAAVCRTGGFGAAARELRISQPTLSKNIQRLEAQLGVKLFERIGRGIRPTTLARLVAARSDPLLRGAAALQLEIEQSARLAAGRLRIGVGRTSKWLLPEIIRRALICLPDLQIETRLDTGEGMMAGLSEGRYDFVLMYSDHPEIDGDMIRVKVFEGHLIAVARPGHPARNAAPLCAAELLKYPITASSHASGFRAWLGDISPNQEKLLERFDSDDFDIIKSFITSSDAIAITANIVFENERNDGLLVEIPLSWKAKYECWMLTTPEGSRSLIIKEIAELLKESQVRG